MCSIILACPGSLLLAISLPASSHQVELFVNFVFWNSANGLVQANVWIHKTVQLWLCTHSIVLGFTPSVYMSSNWVLGCPLDVELAWAFPEQNELFCKADTMYNLYYKTVFGCMYIILYMHVCDPTFLSVLYVSSRNFACDLAYPLGRFVYLNYFKIYPRDLRTYYKRLYTIKFCC